MATKAQSIDLSREQQRLLDELMESGAFANRDTAITAGLRLLTALSDRDFTDKLEDEIDIAVASGPASPMEDSAELIASFRRHRS